MITFDWLGRLFLFFPLLFFFFLQRTLARPPICSVSLIALGVGKPLFRLKYLSHVLWSQRKRVTPGAPPICLPTDADSQIKKPGQNRSEYLSCCDGEVRGVGPLSPFHGKSPPSFCPSYLHRLPTTKWKLVTAVLSTFVLHVLAFEVFLLPSVCVSKEKFVLLPSGSAEFPYGDRNHAQGHRLFTWLPGQCFS